MAGALYVGDSKWAGFCVRYQLFYLTHTVLVIKNSDRFTSIPKLFFKTPVPETSPD